jgi:ABC-type multidrug transport system fused ATPase/permease subunit
MFLDITSRTTGRRDPLTRTFIPGPGFPWAALYEDIPLQLLPSFGGTQPVVPIPVSSYYYFLMDIVVFYALTIYFDQTIANEYGVKRNPAFFLFPSYWGFGVKKSDQENATWLKNIKAKSGGIVVDGQDEAVIEEQEKATNDSFWPAVKLVNIRKVFQQSRFYKKATDKIAVKDASLTFEEGKLLALLGQNGAGKSTTMNILSGKHIMFDL